MLMVKDHYYHQLNQIMFDGFRWFFFYYVQNHDDHDGLIVINHQILNQR